MKTILRYEFENTSFFPRHNPIPRFVKLIDPPVIPATGDIVTIRLEEFFDDVEFLSAFDEHAQGIVYYAERLNTIIGKNEIEVIVLLHEEEVFKEEFPHLFVKE